MSEIERFFLLELGTVLVRPLRSVEDEPAYLRFGAALAPNDLRTRFAVPTKWRPELAARLFGFAGSVFAAFAEGGEILGVGAIVGREFSLTVRSDVKRHGVGRMILTHLISYALEHGMIELVGTALAENQPMLALARSAGFRATGFEGPMVSMRLCLP
jgi:acetyltransferase